MKKIRVMLAAALAVSASGYACAGELDLLLDKMVEKGMLTGGEAQEVRVETQEEVKSEISRGMNQTLPLWLQVMKFKADFRARYQYNHDQNNAVDQYRGRIRLRFGVDSMINDQFSMSFGMASGSSADPRSVNQTLGRNFEKKNVYLDYASANYNLNEHFSFTGGRMKNPIWEPTDMLWKGDINPEGMAMNVSYKRAQTLEGFLNADFFVLDESLADKSDPYMMVAQPGVVYTAEDTVFDMKASAAYYYFAHMKNRATTTVAAFRPSAAEYIQSNTLVGGLYKYRYDSISPALELNYNLLEPIAPAPLSLIGANISYVSLAGEYIRSFDPPTKNRGWIVSAKIGQRKVDDAGQWQFRYSLRDLGADAWMDTYPDSDFYGGATGVKGQKFSLCVGLARNVTADSALYYSKAKATNKKERLAQLDVNLKF